MVSQGNRRSPIKAASCLRCGTAPAVVLPGQSEEHQPFYCGPDCATFIAVENATLAGVYWCSDCGAYHMEEDADENGGVAATYLSRVLDRCPIRAVIPQPSTDPQTISEQCGVVACGVAATVYHLIGSLPPQYRRPTLEGIRGCIAAMEALPDNDLTDLGRVRNAVANAPNPHVEKGE